MPKSYVRADELDSQIDNIIRGLALPQSWQIEVLNIVTSPDERVYAAKQKERIEEKMKRLRRLYSELEISEAEYELEKRRLEVSLASLTVPKEDETVKAGEKLKRMLAIWDGANDQEKAKMLALMLEAVYCDTAIKKIIALKPRQIFLPLFALCNSLQEKNELIFLPDFVGIGDPDGIRTHDLHRDRVAC